MGDAVKLHLISFALAPVVLESLAHAAVGLGIPMIERLQVIAHDLRLRLALAGGVDTPIVTVDFDAKSLAADAC
jgi:hypothetical protein